MIELNPFDYRLRVEKGTSPTVYVRAYTDRQGLARVVMSRRAAPALPEHGTAIDLSSATVAVNIREEQGVGFARSKIHLDLVTGDVSFTTTGTDGLIEILFPSAKTDELQTLATYGWDLVMMVDGTVHRIAASEFHIDPPIGEQLGAATRFEEYRVDKTGTDIYIGEADATAATSAAAWRIRRIRLHDGSQAPAEEWAEGDREFDNIWDDRKKLTYRG